MTDPYPSATTREDQSVGALVSQVTTDITTLVRQEMALAKAELKVEVGKAGKGAGLLGGAGFTGLLLAVFASLALMFALDKAMPTWLAAALVAALYAVATAVLATRGKKQLQSVDPTPHQTIETLKEPLR